MSRMLCPSYGRICLVSGVNELDVELDFDRFEFGGLVGDSKPVVRFLEPVPLNGPPPALVFMQNCDRFDLAWAPEDQEWADEVRAIAAIGCRLADVTLLGHDGLLCVRYEIRADSFRGSLAFPPPVPR